MILKRGARGAVSLCFPTAAPAFLLIVLFHLVLLGAVASDAATDAGQMTPQNTSNVLCKWGFVGSGFHMYFGVEFPLSFEAVHISLEIPRTFFFDVAEAEQRYFIVTLDDLVDSTHEYTPLQIRSRFPFDIEAPAFRVPYNENSVNITFAPLLSGKFIEKNDVEKKLLLLPIHVRYEEVDTVTPLSFGLVFDAQSYVERCVTTIAVQDSQTAAQCPVFLQAQGQGEAHVTNLTTGEALIFGNCRRVPVGVLAWLPFVDSFMFLMQCAGVFIIIFSLQFIDVS